MVAENGEGETAHLLVVGDVHGHWDDVDRAYVEGGAQAAAVFVGDFGDEDVALVERIAALRATKAVLLGNHDARFAMHPDGRRRRGSEERVRRQLEVLGDTHLAWRALELPQAGLALVGARPFSWGGDSCAGHSAFYRRWFDVDGDDASAARLVDAARGVDPGLARVLVGHNGPLGLGAGPEAMFGRDFREPFIDFGDRDQALALAALGPGGFIATVAGHMHEHLAHGLGERRRLVRGDGTVHVNVAVVPRHVDVPRPGETPGLGRLRHFVRVGFSGHAVGSVEDVWIDDDGRIARRRDLLDQPERAA